MLAKGGPVDDRGPYDTEGTALNADADLRVETFLPYRLDVLNEALTRALTVIVQRRFDLSLPKWRVMAAVGPCRNVTAKDIGVVARMHKT